MTITQQPIPATPEQREAVLKHHKAGRDAQTIATITRLQPTVIDQIIHSATQPATQSTAQPSGSRARIIEGLLDIPIDQVHPSPNNPRERLTEIDELAASIRQVGLIQPIVVQPLVGDDYDAWQIVAGHRRYAALKTLGWLNVPCLTRKPLRSDEELMTMLIENGQRAGLDPIEEARALARLKAQQDISEAEVARRVGRPLNFVAGRIMLLSLSVEEQELIRAGITSLTEAKVKARVESGRIRPKAIGRAGVGHLSASHQLAQRAKARCVTGNHQRGRGKGVGGIACGECWEAVIRADERTKIHEASAVAGRCLICDTVHDSTTHEPTVVAS